MTEIDYSKDYNKYACDIVEGKIVSCKNIKLACERYLSWFNRDDIYFDYDDVDRKIRFVNRLRHWEGEWKNKPFILQPWQAWVFAGIFGWKYKETGYRVTENVLIFIARKNGKSSLCAAIALVGAICDNEGAPQVGIFANSGSQSQILFNMCSKYAKAIDPNKSVFRRYRNEIRIPYNDGTIFCKSSNLDTADGYNYHIFIQDETHFQKNWDLWNVLKSSQQSRTQPLAIQITTAGTLSVGYPLYEYRATCIGILNKLVDDDTQFCALYELDEDDDWTDESVWIKANPSYGVSVKPDKLRNEVNRAKINPALEFGVRTKNFNEFIQSANIWITDKYIIDSSKDVDLTQLKGERCWCGVDMSSVSDLTAWSLLFPPNKYRKYYPDKYIFKSWVYVPQAALIDNENSGLYDKWMQKKYLYTTSGNVLDQEYILKDQLSVIKNFMLMEIALDDAKATHYQIYAETEGLNVVPYSQGLYNFTGPTNEFEILVKSNQVIIDNNECVRWAFTNVELKEDHINNKKPFKAGGVYSKKIDPVISMLEALGSYMKYMKEHGRTPQIYAL